MARLRRYLTKWRELAGLDATVEGFETLLLNDQFFATCPKDLRTFLKEKGRLDLHEMTKSAGFYLEAHSEEMGSRTKSNSNWRENKAKVPMISETKIGNLEKPVTYEKPKVGCYICGSTQHRMKDCN